MRGPYVVVRTEADTRALERYQAELDATRKRLIAAGKPLDEFTREMRKLDSQQRQLNKLMPQTHGGFSKLKDLFGGFVVTGSDVAGAVKSIASAVMDVARAGAEAERATSTLRFAVERAGISWDANAAAIDANIQKTSYLAAVDDEELYVAQSKLLRVTRDLAESQQMVALATDISAATGADLNAVTKALTRAYMGNYGGLTRMGVAIDATKDKAEVFAELYKTFGGAAEAMTKDYIGAADRLKLSWEELKETVGTAISPELVPRIDNVSLGLRLLTDATHTSAEKWRFYGSMVGKSVEEQDAMMRQFLGLTSSQESLATATWSTTRALNDLNTALQDEYELLQDVETVLSPVEQGTLDMYEANLRVKRAQQDYNDAVKEHGKKSDEARAAELRLIEAKRRAKEQSDQLASVTQAENDRLAEQRRLLLRAQDAWGSYGATKARSGTGGRNVLVGRASGGPVVAGQTYLVGEQGPELFTPRVSGTIVDARRTQTLASSTSVVVDMRGAVFGAGIDEGAVRRWVASAVGDALRASVRSARLMTG